MHHVKPALIALVISFTILGCRAKPAPDAGFIDNPKLLTTQGKTAPFQRAYWDPQTQMSSYTELYVAPTNMHYMLTQSFWESANEINIAPDQLKMNADQIAAYTTGAFVKAAQNDPKKHFAIVDKAGPHTLILEPAIVQLVPSKSTLQALGYVTWIPTVVMAAGSTLSQSEDQGKGMVAIEARLRDGATGKVVGAFADREHPPTAIVDLKSLNWWAPAKKIIDDWSKQFVAQANDPSGKVKNSSNLELLVW